jgi:hypothetical protein
LHNPPFVNAIAPFVAAIVTMADELGLDIAALCRSLDITIAVILDFEVGPFGCKSW